MAAQVVLVFDAMGGTMSRTTVRTTNAGAIDVVYCAAEEADTWIVQEVGTCSLALRRRRLSYLSRLQCSSDAVLVSSAVPLAAKPCVRVTGIFPLR